LLLCGQAAQVAVALLAALVSGGPDSDVEAMSLFADAACAGSLPAPLLELARCADEPSAEVVRVLLHPGLLVAVPREQERCTFHILYIFHVYTVWDESAADLSRIRDAAVRGAWTVAGIAVPSRKHNVKYDGAAHAPFQAAPPARDT